MRVTRAALPVVLAVCGTALAMGGVPGAGTAAERAAPPAPGADAIVARARQLGIGQDARRLRPRFLPGAHLVATTAPSGSRLGGTPNLPPTVRWPSCDGRRLAFLAQLDLAEVGTALPGVTPASTDRLLVFGGLHQDPDGVVALEDEYGPVRAGSCVRVLRVRSTDVRRARPARTTVLHERPVRMAPFTSIPEAGVAQALLRRKGYGPRYDAWSTLQAEVDAGVLGTTPSDAYEPEHLLLGWSRPVQEDPAAGCEDASGTYPRRLLLQLDYDESLGFAVGDLGALYLTITPADLRAGRFDRLCAEFQEG